MYTAILEVMVLTFRVITAQAPTVQIPITIPRKAITIPIQEVQGTEQEIIRRKLSITVAGAPFIPAAGVGSITITATAVEPIYPNVLENLRKRNK
jgi:hypothetical protein